MLSKTEKQVYALALEGLSYQEMADKMFVSKHTINMHMTNIMKKKNVSSHRELIANELKKQRIATDGYRELATDAINFSDGLLSKHHKLADKYMKVLDVVDYIQQTIAKRPHSDNSILETIREKIVG